MFDDDNAFITQAVKVPHDSACIRLPRFHDEVMLMSLRRTRRIASIVMTHYIGAFHTEKSFTCFISSRCQLGADNASGNILEYLYPSGISSFQYHPGISQFKQFHRIPSSEQFIWNNHQQWTEQWNSSSWNQQLNWIEQELNGTIIWIRTIIEQNSSWNGMNIMECIWMPCLPTLPPHWTFIFVHCLT